MKQTRILSFIGVLALLPGCGLQQPESVIVAVYPSRQQCGVKKEMMKCGEIAAYLSDTLKLKTDREVVVSAVSSDPLPKLDKSLDKIAQTIRDRGYKKIRTVNFDMK
jgi:hypothetical protein